MPPTYILRDPIVTGLTLQRNPFRSLRAYGKLEQSYLLIIIGIPMALIHFETISNKIGTITLNDPERLNAMSEAMAVEFKTLVATLMKNRELRVIILTGAGRAFSAGGDLSMLKAKSQLDPQENRRRMLNYYSSFLSILDLNIPIIVALNGHAIGAGLCLAAACDIRIAAQNAKFGATFTRLGLHPGMGATYSFERLMGYAAASEFMLTGRVIEAQEALNFGLVSRVVNEEDVVKTSQIVAEEILQAGPFATKQLIESLRAPPSSLSKALEKEALAQAISYSSQEFDEGVTAALEKRKPNFNQ